MLAGTFWASALKASALLPAVLLTSGLLAAVLLLSAGCGGTKSGGVSDRNPNVSTHSTGIDQAFEANAIVTRVIDGDTIEADIGGNRILVRFIGIDTPEKIGGYLPAECFGDAASVRTGKLIPAGTALYLERDIELYDRYDRLLAYVYRATDGLFVNQELALSGYADSLNFEPNSRHANMFKEAVATAQRADLGLWGECGSADVKLG